MNWSQAELARIEERRQALGTADVAVESEPLAGGMMSFAGKGAWANQAAGVGLDGPVSDEELDRLVEFYVSRGVDPKIEVACTADATLISGLEERGFTLEGFENVLFREVLPHEDLSEEMPRLIPEGLTIEKLDVEDGDLVRDYMRTAASGFIPEGATDTQVNVDIYLRMFRCAGTAAFIARIDGEIAGAGAMEVTESVSGLFGTSVLPQFRRRGIQAALILRRLEHARDQGCSLAAIHSGPGIPTERNAMRLGFALGYTKVCMRMRGEGLGSST